MKFGLRGIRALLRELGHPQRKFRSIHIAGSNGKGSTAAILASVLTAAGYRTGLYTSPHLVDFSERIRVDGKPIARRDIMRLVRKLKPLVNRRRITFFETATAMAFQYFAEQKIDIAVVETGLGGRLDATNVLRPVLSIITAISKEHTEILGDTLSEIAFEKAGIIKRGTTTITGVRSAAALKVLRRVARRRQSKLVLVRLSSLRMRHRSLKGTRFDGRVGTSRLENISLSLPGDFQLQNCALAITAIEQLRRSGAFQISDAALRRGLSNVQSLGGLQGRLSVIRERPPMIADVAHNPAAVRMLVHALRILRIGNVVLLFGVMKEKDVMSMARALKPVVANAVVVSPKTERARPSAELAGIFRRAGIDAVAEPDVAAGLRRVRRTARTGQSVLITGSHFLVGEVLAVLGGKNYLTINQ
jgi:dihydrofolate synthase/folylpolyglutamate synthase